MTICPSISILGLSIPDFWLGTLLLVLPAVWWGYSPPLQYQQLWEDPLRNLEQMMFLARGWCSCWRSVAWV
jgi:peptide/nickel transport system permease protein